MTLAEYLKNLKEDSVIINRDGKSNYHTHSVYCDGKDTPEEMIEKALELGFRAIGFSGHQYSEPDGGYAMGVEEQKLYREDILALRKKYEGLIEVYLGIERDYFCVEKSSYDYVIGSCHHVKVGDSKWLCVDESPEVLEEGTKEYFGGDYMVLIKEYYDEEADVLRKTEGQIVGHFDLVTKFNSDNRFFDEDSEEYRALALESCDRIIDWFQTNKVYESLPDGFPPELRKAIESSKKPIFEINLGAYGRWRERPYPAPFILEHLEKRGVPLILSVDCHDRNRLVDISIL